MRGNADCSNLPPLAARVSVSWSCSLMLNLQQLDVILRQPALRPIELDVRGVNDTELLQLVILLVLLLHNLNVHSTKDALLWSILGGGRGIFFTQDLFLLFFLSSLTSRFLKVRRKLYEVKITNVGRVIVGVLALVIRQAIGGENVVTFKPILLKLFLVGLLLGPVDGVGETRLARGSPGGIITHHLHEAHFAEIIRGRVLRGLGTTFNPNGAQHELSIETIILPPRCLFFFMCRSEFLREAILPFQRGVIVPIDISCSLLIREPLLCEHHLRGKVILRSFSLYEHHQCDSREHSPRQRHFAQQLLYAQFADPPC